MELTAPADATLLNEARLGSVGAFDEIYRRHRGMAMRVAHRAGHHHDADDVVNEAFTAVLCLLRRGAGPRENLAAYLATCVRNETARRARLDRRCIPTDDVRVLDGPDNSLSERIDAADSDAVHAAMSRLTVRQRELLWALEVEGHRPAEIAERFGQSPNSVAAAAYRARRALRRACRELGLLPPVDSAGATHGDLARS